MGSIPSLGGNYPIFIALTTLVSCYICITITLWSCYIRFTVTQHCCRQTGGLWQIGLVTTTHWSPATLYLMQCAGGLGAMFRRCYFILVSLNDGCESCSLCLGSPDVHPSLPTHTTTHYISHTLHTSHTKRKVCFI